MKASTRTTNSRKRKSKEVGTKKRTPALVRTPTSGRDLALPKSEPLPSSGRPVAVISGERGTALEYASICVTGGYDVTLWSVHPPVEKKDLPERITASTIPPRSASVALELTNVDQGGKRKNIEHLDRALAPDIAILSSSLTVSASEQASWITGRHRLVGFAGLPTFGNAQVVEVAPTVHTPRQTMQVARVFFRSLGKDVELVQDRVGLVSARIICQLINEAAFALQDDIALPEDIDTAMKLGVSYPHGPLEWADRIGVDNVVAVLSALQREYQEERYRVAPLLRNLALGGTWWRRSAVESSTEGQS